MAQLRQGDDDGELGLLAGLVRHDRLLSLDGVLNLEAVDLYGEWTTTWLDAPGERSLETPAVDGEVAFKGVLGARWRPVADLTVNPELFYNGFGSTDPDDYLLIGLSERASIGEQIAWGKWYAALGNQWELAALTSLSWSMLTNLTDPSALFMAAVQHNVAENVDVLAGGYAPVGRIFLAPSITGAGFEPPVIRSEFGNYPYFFFLELRAAI